MTEGLCKHTDRRGRRSLQGQQVACSKIITDNQFIFFVQSNFPRKETTCLACAHNPSVGEPTAPFTQGSLVFVQFQNNKEKQRLFYGNAQFYLGKIWAEKM